MPKTRRKAKAKAKGATKRKVTRRAPKDARKNRRAWVTQKDATKTMIRKGYKGGGDSEAQHFGIKDRAEVRAAIKQRKTGARSPRELAMALMAEGKLSADAILSAMPKGAIKTREGSKRNVTRQDLLAWLNLINVGRVGWLGRPAETIALKTGGASKAKTKMPKRKAKRSRR